MNDLESRDLDLLRDEANPGSLVNLVPSYFASGIRAIPADVFDLSLEELEEQAEVDATLSKLRIGFWLEHDRAAGSSRMISMTCFLRGIASQSYFAKKICTNSYKLAYILTPPTDYKVAVNEMLHLSLNAQRKILLAPLEITVTKTNTDGSIQTMTMIDSKLAGEQRKICENLQNREYGNTIHKSMQIIENRSTNGGAFAPSGGGMNLNNMTREQLEAYRNNLSSDTPRLLNGGDDES